MRRIDEIGEEVRRGLGEPGPGPSDDDLLGALAGFRRSRGRWTGAAVAAALLLLVGAPAILRSGPGQPVVAPPEPERVIAAVDPPHVESDPVAALLFESARLRLEGFGDPGVARVRLVEVVNRYPGTLSARRAGKLLERLEGTER